jgi:cold shock CspA family protein
VFGNICVLDSGVVAVTLGKILKFDEVRGYGFVAPENGGADVFMHANDLVGDRHLFMAGSLVQFEIEKDGRGDKASSVQLVQEVSASSSDESLVTPNRPDIQRLRVADEPQSAAPASQLASDITELLLEASPSMTATQILQVRRRVDPNG